MDFSLRKNGKKSLSGSQELYAKTNIQYNQSSLIYPKKYSYEPVCDSELKTYKATSVV